MIITFILFLLFLIALIIDKHATITVVYPLTLLTTTLPLFTSGHIFVGFNFSIYTIIILLSLSVIQTKDRKNPFFIPVIVTSLGYVITYIGGAYRSSFYPFLSHIIMAIIPLAIFPYFKRGSDINRFIKVLGIALTVSVLYGLIEFAANKNIYMYWLQSQTRITIFHDHIDDIRFGYGRCNSFFDFPIPFGDACAMVFSFILFYLYRFKTLSLGYMNAVIVLCLMIVGIALSNSRAPILALTVGILHIPLIKINIRTFLIVATLSVVSYLFFDNISSIYDSIFGLNEADVNGSSLEMRNDQLLYCINEFLHNPVFGGGFNRMSDLQGNIGGTELMGGESHLFILMVNFGIVGLLTYLLSVLYMIFAMPRDFRKFAFVFTSAWVVADFSSLATGLSMSFPMMLLLVAYRAHQLGMLTMNNNSLAGKIVKMYERKS